MSLVPQRSPAQTWDAGLRGPVALVLPSLQVGGAERNLTALAVGLHAAGVPVELVVLDGRGPLAETLPADLPLIDLGATRARRALGRLLTRLWRHRPSVVLVTVEHASVLALLAGRLLRLPVIVRVATSLTVHVDGDDGGITSALARWCYPRAAALVANSQGSAHDLAVHLGLPDEAVRVLPNLTVDAETRRRRPRPAHPWLADGQAPVVVCVARLDPIKDLGLLLDAIDLLRRRRPVRLLVVGDGPQRDELQRRIAELGLDDAVDLVGHRADPLAYVQAGDLFCLSSAVEGMPNAMIEAMACGVGVVATDCPHGPAELLEHGRWGRLVPPGDPAALAEALDRSLDDPRIAPERAWSAHTVEAGTAAYARLLAEVEAG